MVSPKENLTAFGVIKDERNSRALEAGHNTLKEFPVPSIRVHAHIVHEHLRWERRGGAGRSGPIPADGKVQKDEVALARVEWPPCAAQICEAGRRVCHVRMRRVRRRNRPLCPWSRSCRRYATGPPFGRLGKLTTVPRPESPVNPMPWTEPSFQSGVFAAFTRSSTSMLAAGRPVGGNDVVAHEPTLRARIPGLPAPWREIRCARIGS
jgi:hypothetical protein